MYTPEELLQFTPKPSYFNNLPSHENYFACLFLGLLVMAGCQSKSKKLRSGPAANTS
jgi:SNF family Na+-dependent transporter